MSDLKEYIVTLHDYQDLDEFYDDMETPGGSLYIPDRAVELVNRRPISRNTHYLLTAEEAEQLKNDPRVWDVSLTPAELGLKKVPIWSQTANFAKLTGGGIDTQNTDKNWALYRCTRGSAVSGWGNDGTVRQNVTVNFPLSGKNVDVVIIDGHLKYDHAEYRPNPDGTGATRVVQYNWLQHTPTVTGGSAGTYPYELESEPNHGSHVAGIAAGNTQGWARDANIYNITPYGEAGVSGHEIDYVRAFHAAKPINPNTGVKNPTITNNSYGTYQMITVADMNTYGVQIIHQGTTYSGPWTGTGNGTKLYTELGFNYLANLFGPGQDQVKVFPRSTADEADIADAINEGIHMVFAAGNDGRRIDIAGGVDIDNRFVFPASGYTYYINRLPYAGDKSGALASSIQVGNIERGVAEVPNNGSEKGPAVDIWAPGTGIISAIGDLAPIGEVDDPRGFNGDRLAVYGGTSMAAPQVTGVLACYLELNPTATPAQALSWLTSVAKSGQVNLSLANGATYADPFGLMGAPNKFLFAPTPTFSISRNVSSVSSGESVIYTVTTTDVPNGSTLYLVESGTAGVNAFNDGYTQFTVTINNNTGSVTRTVSSTYSVTSTSTLELRTGGYDGTLQATASSISVVGTYIAPSYSFSSVPGSINEGSTGTFVVTTTNVTNGTTLYWTISHVSTSSQDFSSTSGSIVISSGTASFTITTSADLTTEGNETFLVQLKIGRAHV